MTSGRSALARAAALGPFFAVESDPPQAADRSAWQPFSSLLSASGADLRAGVERTRAALASMGGVEPDRLEAQVAPSLWFLGWATRLVSPWLGAAVTTGVVPVVQVDGLQWRTGGGQPVPLGVLDPGVATPDPEDLAAAVHEHALQPFVEPLLAATDAAYSVSGQVLWGNVASALAGAADAIGRAMPTRSAEARTLVRALLETGPLAGRGSYAGDRFRRQTCCLLYRVPGAGLCPDCVLVGR